MTIEFNIYGCEEYTVQYHGDDVWFYNEEDAKAFIRSVEEGES